VLFAKLGAGRRGAPLCSFYETSCCDAKGTGCPMQPIRCHSALSFLLHGPAPFRRDNDTTQRLRRIRTAARAGRDRHRCHDGRRPDIPPLYHRPCLTKRGSWFVIWRSWPWTDVAATTRTLPPDRVATRRAGAGPAADGFGRTQHAHTGAAAGCDKSTRRGDSANGHRDEQFPQRGAHRWQHVDRGPARRSLRQSAPAAG